MEVFKPSIIEKIVYLASNQHHLVMGKKNIIERFGGLIKEEPLTCLQDDILMPGTCVLESVSPFFGYYSHEPQAHQPQYLYCVLNGYYSFETITRATQNIRRHFKHAFDAVTGNITLDGVTNQVIRIRNLKQYNHISELQRLYFDEGIMLKKKLRKFENEMAMIKLRKFMWLEPIDKGILIDKAQAHHAYFILPHQIDWEHFIKLTDQVKYDPNYFYFDGAIAFIYEQGEIRDMVRIYRENFSIEEIHEICEKYQNLLKQ
jgi:hypothetical protein